MKISVAIRTAGILTYTRSGNVTRSLGTAQLFKVEDASSLESPSPPARPDVGERGERESSQSHRANLHGYINFLIIFLITYSQIFTRVFKPQEIV